MYPTTESLFNSQTLTFPIYALPNGVAKLLVEDLSPSSLVALSGVCRRTFTNYNPFFEALIGRTPESLEAIKALMERFELEFAWPTPPKGNTALSAAYYRIAQADAIRVAIAPNWASDKVGQVIRHFFGDTPRTTPPSKAQIDGIRLLASIPAKERVKTLSKNDVLFFHKAFETFDSRLIRQTIRPIMSAEESESKARVLGSIFTKAHRALFATPPLKAYCTEEEKQETMTQLARAQNLLNYFYEAEEKQSLLAGKEVTPEKHKLRLTAFEELSRFILQLRGATKHPMAYSNVTKRLQEAPQGLYTCLSKIEDSLRCKNRDELMEAMNTLMNAYLPTYFPTFSCMLVRLYAGRWSEPTDPNTPMDETQQLFRQKLNEIITVYPDDPAFTFIYFMMMMSLDMNPAQNNDELFGLTCEQWEIEAISPLSKTE